MEETKPAMTMNINLDGLVGKLNIQLQYLSDVLKFSNTAVDNVKDQNYNDYSAFAQFNTADNQKLSYDKAKTEFQEWCLRNGFRDSVETISVFLEECHLTCALLDARENCQIKIEDYNQIVSEKKKRFHKMNFPTKITFLRENFSISSSLEKHVLSLNKVRNCLVHRSGIVGQQDLNTDNELIAKLREIQFIALTPDKTNERVITGPTIMNEGEHLAVRTQDCEKHFRLGQKIDFAPLEHSNTVYTFLVFGQEIHKSIVKFAGISV